MFVRCSLVNKNCLKRIVYMRVASATVTVLNGILRYYEFLTRIITKFPAKFTENVKKSRRAYLGEKYVYSPPKKYINER